MTSKSQVGDGDSGVARSEIDEATDEDLLLQIERGHRGSVELLYRRHGPSILALLTRILDDYQLAEEAVQDTFLGGLERCPFRGAFSSPNLVGGDRTPPGRIEAQKIRFSVAPARDVVSREPGPEESAVASLEVSRLVEELSQLSERQREVLLLAFVEQLTQSEIAELLGVRLGTVKSRMHGAKRALERRWKEGVSE